MDYAEYLEIVLKDLKIQNEELQEHIKELRNDLDESESENIRLQNELDELKESMQNVPYSDADYHERY